MRNSGLDEIARNVEMERCRHGHAHSVHPADDAAMVRNALAAELFGDRARSLLIAVDHRHKLGARIA